MTYKCKHCQDRKYILKVEEMPLRMDFTSTEVSLQKGPSVTREPCPYCKDTQVDERIYILTSSCTIDAMFAGADNSSLLAHQRHHLSYGLIDKLLSEGFIRVRQSEPDRYTQQYEVSVEMAVVHPTKIMPMEIRIQKHEDSFAEDVVQEAIKQILNWRSVYSDSSGAISKIQAATMVQEALSTVKNRRNKNGKSA